MDEPRPEEGSGPFDRLPFYADLARIPPTEEPVNWTLARQVAVRIAGQGNQGGGSDPGQEAQLVRLTRVAEMHVAAATGLPTTVTGHPLTPVLVTPAGWASRALDAQLPLLTALATALTKSIEGGAATGSPGEGSSNPGRPAPSTLEGFVFGWMLAQLARRSLGQYDLPLPWPPTDEIVLVPGNLEEFAQEWRLPGDDLRLWVCVRDIVHHCVLGLAHVRQRFQHLLQAHAAAFRVDPSAYGDQIEALDPADPSSFLAVLGDPESVVTTVETGEQRELLDQLEALVSAIEGYVGHVVEGISAQVLGEHSVITEAMRRRRADASWGDRFVAKLLGLELRQRLYDRGHSFVEGVVERAGEEALSRLWRSAWELPTPAEIDAPGLWLARVELGPGEL